MLVEFLQQTFMMGRHVPPGEVMDLPPHLALQAVGCCRAKFATANADKPQPVIPLTPEVEPSPIVIETKEATLPRRNRRNR